MSRNVRVSSTLELVRDGRDGNMAAPIVLIQAKNDSGGALARGDVVIWKKASMTADLIVVTTTTTGKNADACGIVYSSSVADAAIGWVQTWGPTNALKANGATDIAAGDYLGTFTTAKIAQKTNGQGAFAIAMKAYTADDSLGVIDAFLLGGFNLIAATSGTGYFADGTEAAPSVTFEADTDNGFYRVGANNWAAVAGGQRQLDFATGAIVANEDGDDTDLRIESDTNTNALNVDAGLFTGVGAIGIGSAAVNTAAVTIDPPATTAASNTNYAKLRLENTSAVTITAATTSALVASLSIDEPNIAGTGTVTVSASVYIEAAASEATNNWALFIDAGHVRLDGVVNQGITTVDTTGGYVQSGNLGTTGVTQYGIYTDPEYQSAATTAGRVIYARLRTAASAFTMVNGYGIYVDTPSVGSTSTITTAHGIFVATNTANGATTNYGVRISNTGGGSTTVGTALNIDGNGTRGAPGLTGVHINVAAATITDSSTAASGTAATAAFTSFGIPTLAASNLTVTTTDAATVYVAGQPAGGTNMTVTDAWSVWVDAGRVRLDSTATIVSAAGATLRALYLPAATITVSGSTGITTATGFNFVEIGTPTISNASITIDLASTVYIAAAPVASGGAVITTAYSLWVDAGISRFDGAIHHADGTVLLPGVAFQADTDSGMYRIGTNNIGFATNGVKVLDLGVSAHSLTGAAASGGADTFTITGGAHTAMLLEKADLIVAAHTDTITGAITTQRFSQFLVPTITAATALTVTTAATAAISATPNPTGAGPATITNAFALMLGTALATVPVYSASVATTITNAAMLYVAGAPATGGSVTVTNPYAIWVDDGTTRLDGALSVGGATLTTGNELTVNGQMDIIGAAVSGGDVEFTLTPGAHTAVLLETIAFQVAAHTITVTGNITTQRFEQHGVKTISAATALTTTTAATVAIDGTPNPTGAGPATITNAFGLMLGTALATVPTYSASNATTIADAAMLYIAGAPSTGGSVTVTRGYALWSDGGLIRSDGAVVINDTAISSLMTTGITINQGGADDEILALQSSDVAHGVTGTANTDTFGYFSKASATGGLLIGGVTPNLTVTAIQFLGVGDTTTTKSTAGTGVFSFDSYENDGTATRAAMTADSNMLVVRSNTTTRFILDADGDSHQDVGTAWTNFDTYDDVALLTDLSRVVSRDNDPIKQDFGDFLRYNREVLENAKLIGKVDEHGGRPLLNMSKLTMLHTGAIRQLHDKFERAMELVDSLTSRLAVAEARLAALPHPS